MIYYFYVCSLTGGIIGIFLGIFVYVKSKNILTNKIFAFLCFVSGVWSLTQFGYYIASNKQIALTLTRISNATAIFIAVAFMHFIYFLTGKYRQNKSILKASIIIGLILLLFTPTKLFIKNVVPLMMFTWFPQRGSFIYDIFALFFSICVILSLTELIKNINKTKGIEKYRLKYILLASILGFIGGATTFPMVYNISFPPYGFILFVFYPLIIAYAIIKHHLMDIRLAITRGTVFGLVYSIILGFVFLLGFVFQDMLYSSFGKLMWIGPAIIAVILASIGPSIYIKIKEKAEWTLFTRQKEYQDTLTEMGKKMTLTKDLNDLLTWVTRAITVNVGVSYTRIFLWDEDEEEYTLRKEYGIERRKQYDLDLSKDNPVIQYLEKYKEPALRDEIISYYEAMDKNKAELAGKTLRNTGAELLVPSFIKDHMIGFLTMGLKRNHRIYTPEDINMFRILAGQASLA
ncbi:MAG: histidine kinase N-terminal 7TM domain-containing protein, partial [Elusimicrobiota bacterium]